MDADGIVYRIVIVEGHHCVCGQYTAVCTDHQVRTITVASCAPLPLIIAGLIQAGAEVRERAGLSLTPIAYLDPPATSARRAG